METYRVKFTDIDSSEIFLDEAKGLKGFFNISAPKGNKAGFLFPKGAEATIKRLIGYPSATYPAIQDVIDYNAKYSCYIAAPTIETTKKGYAAITQFGVYPFQSVDGDISGVGEESVVPIIDGEDGATVAPIADTSVTITLTADAYAKYSKISGLKVKLNSVTAVDFADFNETTFDLTIDDATLDVDNYTLDWLVPITAANTLFTISQVSPTALPLRVNITDLQFVDTAAAGLDAAKTKFDLKLSYVEDNYPNKYVSQEISGNLDFTSELEDGTKNYIGDKISEYSSIEIANINLEIPIETGYTSLTGSTTIAGEARNTSDVAANWVEGQKDIYDDVKVFMDPEGTLTEETATSLRANNQTSSIISIFNNYSVLEGTKLSKADSEVILTGTPQPIKGIKGFVQYHNKFKISESFTNTSYWTSFIGKIGVKLSDIMVKALGGASPMFLDDARGLGGQLDVDFDKIFYTYSEDAQKNFDKIGVNAIFWDKNYGVYIGGQKTSFSRVGVISDWGYIGHSMAFDIFRDSVKQTVLIPQIGKALSPKYYEIRGDQMAKLISQRVDGTNPIWASARYEHVNKDQNKALRKYVVKVWVKVYPFAEETELIFENEAQ